MNKKKTLDCESLESLDESLKLILRVPINELNDFLMKFDLDEAYAQRGFNGDKETLLVEAVSTHFNLKCNLDGTCWFHVTRAFDKKDLELGIFELGILPSDQILDKIWNDLFTLVKEDFSKKEWIHFRERLESKSLRGQSAHIYNLKLEKDYDKGPMALLIGETIFSKREDINEDYLDLPELIRDIGRCFYEEFEYDLLSKYLKSTKKYMIKFKTDQPDDFTDEFKLGVAMYYKYRSMKGIDELYWDKYTSFSGHGKSIPPKDIIKIEDISDRDSIPEVNRTSYLLEQEDP